MRFANSPSQQDHEGDGSGDEQMAPPHQCLAARVFPREAGSILEESSAVLVIVGGKRCETHTIGGGGGDVLEAIGIESRPGIPASCDRGPERNQDGHGERGAERKRPVWT